MGVISIGSGIDGFILEDSLGRRVRGPDEETVRAAAQTLARGEHLVISAMAEGGRASSLLYAQVWLRRDGIYQVEYRDGTSPRHWRAVTVSGEKAAGFLAGWCTSTPGFTSGFQWEDIGPWLATAE